MLFDTFHMFSVSGGSSSTPSRSSGPVSSCGRKVTRLLLPSTRPRRRSWSSSTSIARSTKTSWPSLSSGAKRQKRKSSLVETTQPPLKRWDSLFFCTVRYPSATPIIRHRHHPISSASFNLKSCYLVCGTQWPKSATSGPVVPEIWPNMWENHRQRRRKKKSSKWQNPKCAEILFGFRFWW